MCHLILGMIKKKPAPHDGSIAQQALLGSAGSEEAPHRRPSKDCGVP